MNISKPFYAHTGATVPADGEILADPAWRSYAQRQHIAVVVQGTFDGLQVQMKESVDGIVWHNLGTAISAAGVTVVTPNLPRLKADLVAISSGSVTVILC